MQFKLNFCRAWLSVAICLFVALNNYAQTEPQPCDDPDNNGIGCFCGTAGILCTPDDLNNFEFSMSNVDNLGDLPFNDLCPGLPDGGFGHNVNFFAFIVWCESLTFNVEVSNCAQGGGGGFNYGIQMALFANCGSGNSGWDPVECITNFGETCYGSQGAVPSLQVFTASGLEIGATYYFMVDGCSGSTCKVKIVLQTPCGNGEIDPWTNGIFGPQSVCVGDTETYTAEDITVGLDGAEEYYYYLDGVLIDEGEELYTTDITWDNPGTYQLCVDVSNLPCVPESSTPAQNCISIIVTDPGDGDINATPNPLCPDATSTITVSNNNSDPLLSQYIIIVGPDGTVVQIVEALTTTLTYDLCGVFTAYYYSFVTADNPTLPMVGDVWTLPDCSAECCYTDDVIITFEDDTDPEFTDAPADVAIDCAEDIIEDEPVTWTDNCAGTGTVIPSTVVEDYTGCDGGTVTRTWTFTDSCANNVEYTQTITIEPIAIPVFLSPPADSIIDCDMAQTFLPTDLEYSNSGTGTCNISGIVSPTSSGTFDLCGSSVTYTWEFTDECMRTISYNQVVTVEEVGAANEFINPPGDTTITCLEWLAFTPATLNYSNNLTGGCEISGSVSAVTTDVHDPCGSSITYTWDFTDVCNRSISHTQVVTIEPKVEAGFVNPPGNITINCDELQTFSPEVLTYTNGGTGACLIEGMVSSTSNGTLDTCGNSVTYTWDFTDDCNRSITHSQIVTVEPIPIAFFVNPPGNVSIDCNELQIFTPAILTYTNGESGNCLIEGMVNSTSNGTLDTCGNSVTYSWEFTDNCGRTITHSQIVTVVPIAEASFINPPGNTNINCDELQTFIPAVLTYSNGGIGNCLIEGTIDPTANGTLDICGSMVTYTWDFTDNCGRQITHTQIVTVDPIPEAAFVNPPGNISIDCDELQTFTPAVLTYSNGGTGNCLIEGTADPVGDGTLEICGNEVTYTWEFTDQCGRFISHSQTVTVEPIPEAAFVNPPGNINIDCDDLQTFVPEVLSFTNGGTGNCLIEGTVDPVGDGEPDICGNEVIYTWEFEDVCGRTISHAQTVTVEPIPEAAFVNPPGNLTINCDELQTFVPEVLSYTNGGTGNCLIEGTVDPVGDGTLDICGNSVTYTWEFVDDCGRTISHAQTVTVEPIPEATFVDPPADMSFNCDDFQAFTPAVLTYTNGGTGGCLIEGTVDPVGDGELDICGNSVTYTWEFVDDCGRTISHAQTVTVEPIPEATFVNPPGDISYNCDDFQAFVPAVLSYTNSGTAGCLIEGTVDPVGDGELDICGNSVTYTWEFVDDCGRTISHAQTVTVEPIDPPAFIDPPADETVACNEKPNEGEGPDLSYTNGGADDCETAGMVSPVEEYNATECGGEIIYTWTYTDDCGNEINHTQTITVQPAPKAQFENLPPSSITIACSENTDMGPELVVTNNGVGDCLIEEMITPTKIGDADVCGGAFQFLWEFTDDCGRITSFSQTVNVEPAATAVFDNLPTDIDIECSENADVPEDLSYSNGESGDCEIVGEVSGVRSGAVDYCGGVLVDTWEFTDQCGQTISTQRNVNVAPAPPAEFINPPNDIVVGCDNVNTIATNLAYSNGEAGICLISGTRSAVISGSYDACGGELIYTWSFVDACGRAITHSQNLTVEPADDPIFINPPDDLVVQCDETYSGPENLNYTNGFIGECAISGVAIPSSVQDDNIITNTWELFLPCSGDLLVHTQVVTLSIMPDISVNPSSVFLCLGDDYDLGDLIVDETNGTSITISYHDAFPPTSANEIGPIVNPTTDFIYVINATNEFDCEDYELINIFVEAPPFAGDDQSTTVCTDGIPLDLFDFIPAFADMNGTWLDLDGIGANISNPNGATFNNVLPGNYNLYYVVYSTTVCDNDTMVLNIEVIDQVTFEITEVICIGSNDFYEVYLNSNGFTIQATEGDLVNISGNEYVVTNIPITTGVFISAFEIVSGCSVTEFIDIPDCDCPEINPPTGNNISICINDQPVVLSVSVPSGMTANWYFTQNSNTPFLEGSTDFTIQDSTAGNFSFYVETYDPATECSSNVKLKIDVEINSLPPILDAMTNICDIQNDGQEMVSLQSFNALINNNSANAFSYFELLADAEANTNPLSNDQIINLGTTTLFVRVTNSANCSNIGELQLILNDLPIADIDITGPECIGEVTGSIEITATDVDGDMETSLDGITYSTTSEYTNLSSGLYTVYVRDENDCVSTYNEMVPVGLQILFTVFSAECNDNGTNTDPSDDFYTITLRIENNKGNNGTYNVIFNGSTQYTYNYGSDESFVIPIDAGNNINITIEDVALLCSKEQTFGPLNPCSTNCEVSIDVLDLQCDDNGTTTDPSDDYYTVTINASAMNGSQNNTYNVFLDGVLLYNFTYGENETFDVDASGNNLNITCQDNQDIQCQTSTDIGPLQSCSGGCQIELDIISSVCDNNGTSTIQNDDFYTFTIIGNIVNGSNLNQFELFVDGSSQGFFNYGEDITVNIAADELTHLISISDDSNAGCEDSFTSNILSNCSTDCEILSNAIEELCFDNGTPQDPDDDYYEITINFSSVNGASNGLFNLYVDGLFTDDYPYNQDNVITIPADNTTHTLRIQDSEELACELVVATSILTSCSGACLNALTIENFECFNNGSTTNIDDDYYEFNIRGLLLNGDSNASFDLYVDGIVEGSYAYDELINVTIDADNGSHIFLIIDSNDPSCTFEIQTGDLVSCSTDCEINMSNLVFNCFDNGTPDDPSDDFYEVSFSADAINGSNGFSLTASGMPKGNFNYGDLVELNFPADGTNLILVLRDLNDVQCVVNQVIGALDPCSDLCTIEPLIMDAQCFDNGTPIDPLDDYWEVIIFVNPANGETAPNFELRVDGTLNGIYPYSENITITIPADNSTHQIRVNDVDDVSCDAMVTTGVLNYCSTPCEITAIYDNVICDNNGTNDTGTDDIYYLDLTVSNPDDGQYEIPILSFNGNYNQTINIGPFNIADGITILQIVDMDQNLCFIEIELIPPTPCSECEQVVDAGIGGTISCEMTEINLVGSSTEDGEYSWYGPSGNLVSQQLEATAVSVGTFTFSVLFEDGCVAEDQVEVDADVDLPMAILTSDGAITCLKLTSELDGSASGSVDDFFFYWYNEDGDLVSEEQIFLADVPGVYFLQVESKINNCKSALEAVIVEAMISEPMAIIYAEPSNVIDCVIESIILSTEQEENVNYIWSFNGAIIEDVIELEISEIGTYGLLAIDTITGCSGDVDLIISSLVDYPNIMLGAPEMLNCENEEVIITASTFQSNQDLSSYWTDENQNIIAENQFSLEVSQPGEYYFTLIDNNNGCENTDTILIELFITDVEIIIEPEVTYIEGESVQLAATVNINSSEISSINWTPDENMSCPTCLSTRISFPTDSIYTITVIDINGCIDSAEVRLIRKERPEIFIPNVLNIGSNFGNDRFTIYGNEEVELVLKLQIYDRWGNLLYAAENMELNNPAIGWDGTFNGRNTEQGVYVYVIEALLTDGSIKPYFGDLTVLR